MFRLFLKDGNLFYEENKFVEKTPFSIRRLTLRRPAPTRNTRIGCPCQFGRVTTAQSHAMSMF